MSQPAAPHVSLVLPAYNEEANLAEAVAQAMPVLDGLGTWEVVVVNDASTDGTAALADALARADDRVRVVHHARNAGLGGALRTGFAHARGAVVAYSDADLPYAMGALAEAHAVLERTGADVVAGYRLNTEAGLRRRLYSRGYNGLIRLALGLPVRDVNFALKLIRRPLLERLALSADGSFIDAELLARARRAGARFAEVGVVYTPRVAGVSTLARPAVIAGIVRDLVRFRLGLLPRRPLPPTRAASPAPGAVAADAARRPAPAPTPA